MRGVLVLNRIDVTNAVVDFVNFYVLESLAGYVFAVGLGEDVNRNAVSSASGVDVGEQRAKARLLLLKLFTPLRTEHNACGIWDD